MAIAFKRHQCHQSRNYAPDFSLRSSANVTSSCAWRSAMRRNWVSASRRILSTCRSSFSTASTETTPGPRSPRSPGSPFWPCGPAGPAGPFSPRGPDGPLMPCWALGLRLRDEAGISRCAVLFGSVGLSAIAPPFTKQQPSGFLPICTFNVLANRRLPKTAAGREVIARIRDVSATERQTG